MSNDRLLTETEVRELLGISRSTLLRLRREPDFPAARQITKRRIGYLSSEISGWMETLSQAGTRDER